LQQILEEETREFHSLFVHDFNVDGISEIIASRLQKSSTEISVLHPKHLANSSVKINERINVLCVAQTSLDKGFELITGDIKGVLRINARNGRPFYSKDIKDGIRLPSSILAAAPGDLNGNKLSEIVVGCANGEVVMIERIPGRKHRWDKIRGFSLGKVFQKPVTTILTGDFNGNGYTGFIAGSEDGFFKEIEFRPQLQKFDLIGEFKVESPPSFCFCGDFDRDGISEVMVGEQSGKLNIFKRNYLMSSHTLDGAITCGVVGDVDNDHQLEVVVGTSRGSFHILRSNTIETHEGYSNIADLKIGDLYGNRQNELIFSINKRRILAFTITRDKASEKSNVELIPFKDPQQLQARTPQPSVAQNAFCPNCSSQVRFIEQYRRWYCYTCRQYVAPVSKKEEVKRKVPTIEAKKYGTPYSVGSHYDPYRPYEPTRETAAGGASKLEKVKDRVESKLADLQPGQNLEWQEEIDENGIVDAQEDVNYFLPLDLEADLDVGVSIFNDILKIKHVILIHSQSGVPLFSQGFGKDIDVSLTSGFLSAVGTFTEEMAGESEKRIGVFSEIGREGFWIIIYEGEMSKTALLVSEKIGEHLKKRIQIFMKEFEQTFKTELENFNGFISAFKGATDLLEKHLRLEYLYPLKMDAKRMRLTAINQNEKTLAKAFTDFLSQTDEEVFYVTELIDVIMQDPKNNLLKEDVLKILIKYLENGMLIPLPPPPTEHV